MNAQESDGRYVEVTGSSEIEVVPDEIHFLVQIKEYWQEEYTGKSKKEELKGGSYDSRTHANRHRGPRCFAVC